MALAPHSGDQPTRCGSNRPTIDTKAKPFVGYCPECGWVAIAGIATGNHIKAVQRSDGCYVQRIGGDSFKGNFNAEIF